MHVYVVVEFNVSAHELWTNPRNNSYKKNTLEYKCTYNTHICAFNREIKGDIKTIPSLISALHGCSGEVSRKPLKPPLKL